MGLNEKKRILARLMALENEEANKALGDFAVGIKDRIFATKKNDNIIEELKLLQEFVYKVPAIAIEISQYLIKAKPFKATIFSTKFGKQTRTIEGADYGKVINEVLEVLDRIRYIDPDKVFALLINAYQNETITPKDKVKESLSKLAKYDLHLLRKIGCQLQRHLLDVILGWPEKEKVDNLQIILIIGEELLKSSFEGTSWSDEKTITFHSGSLNVDDFIKKIRRDTLELLLGLEHKLDYENESARISVLKVCRVASDAPMSVAYGDDVKNMIISDIEFLTNQYENILLMNNTLGERWGVVKEIDSQLVWFSRNYSKEVPKIKELLGKLKSSIGYNTFRLLVGGINEIKEDISWESAEKEQKEKTDKILSEINQKNLNEWDDRLNKIASYFEVIDEWKFQVFRNFLRLLAHKKTNLAREIFIRAHRQDRPIKQFTVEAMSGLRIANDIKSWDEIKDLVIQQPTYFYQAGISYSLQFSELKNLRAVDLKLLENLVFKKKPFAGEPADDKYRFMFSHALISTSCYVFKYDEKFSIKLITKLLKEEAYLPTYIRELQFAMWGKKVSLSSWSDKDLSVLASALIATKDLDYDAQDLLLELGKIDFKFLSKVFTTRIQKDKTKDSDFSSSETRKYDPIPYHINPELISFLSNHKDYPKFISDSIKLATIKFSTYNWELAQLLKTVGGQYSIVLTEMARNADKKTLQKITKVITSGIDTPDYDICLEIIRQIKDKNIWSEISAKMFSTGVVSGEFGIAEAYEHKRDYFKQYLNSTNKNIKEFATKLVEDLDKNAKAERLRAEEDIRLRKSEFEA